MTPRTICCCRPCLSPTIHAAIRRIEADQPEIARAILELLASDLNAIARSPDRPCAVILAAVLPSLVRAAEKRP